MTPLPLAGRTALVTGASRGIGRAAAVELAARGAGVAVGFRSGRREAEETVALIQRRQSGRSAGTRPAHAFPLPIDLSDPASVAEAADALRERWGRVDVLVNNAGILVRRPLLETDEEDWARVIGTNLAGPFRVVRAIAPLMREGGVIVNVSSVNAWRPSVGAGAYAVSKAGVTMLTRQLAVELAPRGIRVNEVNPGTVETDLNRRDLANPEFRASRERRMLLGRLGRPEDVAAAIAFLADPACGWMTGTSLTLDGGSRLA